MRSLSGLAQLCAVLLLPASGIMLYWLYKKSSASDEEIYGLQRVTTARNTVLEVKVPKRAVGAVIGRQGVRIKEVQKITGARINFRDAGAGGDEEESTFRMCIIHGTLDAAHQAELMILQMIADMPEPITEQVEVPAYALGRIIGKGGSSIRELCAVSGAKITVERNDFSSDRQALKLITLMGTQQQIDVALQMLEEKLADEEKFRAKVNVMGSNREERHNHGTQDRKEHIKTKPVPDQTWEDPKHDPSSVRQEKLPLTDGLLQVYVSAVEHPGHFWLQVLGSKALHLERIQTDMSTWVLTDDARLNYTVTKAVPGQLVAAKYEPNDPTYYRAKVLCETDNGLLDLYFVDYGDNAFVEKSQVLKLRSDFESFPFQAVECSLSGVQPLDGGTWSDEAITAFEDLSYCAQWKLIHARVVPETRSHESQSHPLVELLDPNESETVNISQELISRGVARHVQDKSLQSSYCNNVTPIEKSA